MSRVASKGVIMHCKAFTAKFLTVVVPYVLARKFSNTKWKLLYKITELSLVVFHISLLLETFSKIDS